jgi:hypothetical protein
MLQISVLLGGKKNCIEFAFHSPPLAPLLTAPTLSAGEHKVSGGESKVSRQVGLPHSLRPPRSKPKMASLLGKYTLNLLRGVQVRSAEAWQTLPVKS